ncbi:DNA-binding protein [Halomonas sp. H10-59]|uniref:DNA-binding protein n=1 Tax=Halomonas sp. H10-59 TaxID=2950874 RepID=A0AAU7L070_9GAMM
MARTGITYDDVQRAVDTLLKQQEAPSVQKVREILGTGSFTTISEHLREWRSRREERRDVPPPQGMPVELQGLAEELWSKAQEAAAENLAHYRQEADRNVEGALEKVAAADRRAEDAEQRESALSAHLSSMEQRLQEAASESARLASANQALEQQLIKEGERATQLEAQLDRLQQDKEREGREYQQALDDQQKQHRERLAQEEQRHEAAEARLMAMLDEARQERQSAEKAHAQRLKQADQRQEVLQQQLQALRGELSEEEKRHRETQMERSRAEENLRARGHEVDLLNERIEEQRRLLANQSERLKALEAKLDEKIWALARQQRERADDKEGTSSGNAKQQTSSP